MLIEKFEYQKHIEIEQTSKPKNISEDYLIKRFLQRLDVNNPQQRFDFKEFSISDFIISNSQEVLLNSFPGSSYLSSSFSLLILSVKFLIVIIIISFYY